MGDAPGSSLRFLNLLSMGWRGRRHGCGPRPSLQVSGAGADLGSRTPHLSALTETSSRPSTVAPWPPGHGRGRGRASLVAPKEKGPTPWSGWQEGRSTGRKGRRWRLCTRWGAVCAGGTHPPHARPHPGGPGSRKPGPEPRQQIRAQSPPFWSSRAGPGRTHLLPTAA